MAFCTQCGQQIPDGSANCPSCGAPQNNTQNFVNNFANTANTTSQFDPADIQNNKVMAVLAYIGILFLIPLLAAPDSKFARYHTNQGLVLFIAQAILVVALGILGAILALIPIVGAIVIVILSLAISVVSLVFMILGIVNAANGTAKELPLIGGIKILK